MTLDTYICSISSIQYGCMIWIKPGPTGVCADSLVQITRVSSGSPGPGWEKLGETESVSTAVVNLGPEIVLDRLV